MVITNMKRELKNFFRRIRRYKGSSAIYVCMCVLMVVCIIWFNWQYFDRIMDRDDQNITNYNDMYEISQNINETSSTLIYLVRNFMLTGNISNFEEYWDIQNSENGREQLINSMFRYKLTSKEIQSLDRIHNNARTLEEYEVFVLQEAFDRFFITRLNFVNNSKLLEYYDYTINYDLSHCNINEEAKYDQTALSFLLDNKYHDVLGEMQDDIEILLLSTNTNISEEDKAAQEISHKAILFQVMCILLVVSCIVILMLQNNRVYSLRNMSEMIVSEVSEEYHAIYMVNLLDYRIVKLKGNSSEWGIAKDYLDFVELSEIYVDNIVHKAYKEIFMRSVQPENIIKKIDEGQAVISCIYRNNDDDWLMMDITKSKDYSKENPVVIITFKNAGEIIQQQNDQRQRDEMLMYFSREYFEVYVVDLNKGSYEIIRSAERYGNYIKNLTGDFSQLMELATSTWSKPPYKQMFKQLTDMDDVKKRFASGVKKIEFIYESNDENWKRLQCFPVPEYRIGNEKMIFALGDYNEEMQIRTNEVLASEAMNNIYSLVAFRDIEADRYECIHCSDFLCDFPEKGSYQELVDITMGIIHEDDKEKYLSELSDERFERDGRAECEYRLRDREGVFHYYHEYITKVDVPSGSRMVILVKNIDESKMHEIWEAEQLQKELKAKAKELEMTKLLAKKSKDLEKALQQAESANDAKSKFLSNMSHDLRTPMNAILGMTYLAKKHSNDPDQLDNCLNTILTSSQGMLALINDVLDMNKIESGVVELHIKPSNLAKIVEDIEVVIRNRCEANQQMLVINKDGLKHSHFFMDDIRVRQILTNLLSNAVKYTQSFGQVSLEIAELSGNDENNSNIQFVIKDNGIGMSKEFVERIFEPFEREKTVLSDKIEGTGLGMAIVKNLIDIMKGTIEIDSMINVGTKVTVVLPFEKCDITESAVEIVDLNSVQNKYPGKNILIVEDKRINLEIVKGFLEDTELEIDEARNGKEALEKIEQSEENTYDLIFMDIRMPVMRGDEATKAIRALDREDCKKIPIIAMTANALESDVENSFKSGMSGHISKPIEPEEVYKCLNKWLLEDADI